MAFFLVGKADGALVGFRVTGLLEGLELNGALVGNNDGALVGR